MLETPEMVEAVARAICRAVGRDPGRQISTPFVGRKVMDWDSFSDIARAAIQAMRAPPEAVLGAIHDKVRIECRPGERAAYIVNADEMWAAGIDAMLAQTGGKESLRTAPAASPEEGREP